MYCAFVPMKTWIAGLMRTSLGVSSESYFGFGVPLRTVSVCCNLVSSGCEGVASDLSGVAPMSGGLAHRGQ